MMHGPAPRVPPERESPWADPVLAAKLLLIDPPGLGGIVVAAMPGPARDAWLALVRRALPPPAPIRKLPAGIADDRLLGGLDLVATLNAGRPVADRGLLAEADGGLIVIPMAERLSRTIAAHLAAVLDAGEIVLERYAEAARVPARFGVIALDEGLEADERLPDAVADRCAFRVDLRGIGAREPLDDAGEAADIDAARARLGTVVGDAAIMEALCAAGLSLGIESLRGSLFAYRAAVAHAALIGRDSVSGDDAAVAARLVLAPRARRLPVEEQPADEEPPPPDQPPPEPPEPPEPSDDSDNEPRDQELSDLDISDIVLAAAEAAIPENLLAQLRQAQAQRNRPTAGGRAGALRTATQRGRPVGVRRGSPGSGARLNVIETLRAAAPWQKVRRRAAMPETRSGTPRIQIRRDDFRVTRRVQRGETLTIFVVDASGSAALHRLAEAKGAVEHLLAECYVRRDQVALLAFRQYAAEVLLPPTRSLARAKRCLAALPGGGATPLAAGLDAAAALADSARRKELTPVVVVMTDGRANISRDGRVDREAAEAEALAAARRLRGDGVSSLLVDISPRARPQAKQLATELAAVYLSLPYADAPMLSGAIQANMGTMRR